MEKINYSTLIHKRLTGEISSEETIVLDNWLSSNATHPIIAEDLRKVWIWSQSKVSGWEPDVEGGLVALKQRIKEDEKGNTPKRPIIISLFKYAAAAMLIFSLGYFASGVGEVELNWQIAETDKDEVMDISLTDGSKVTLNEGTYFKFPEEFSEENRVVKMDGEGFFEIAADKNRPFSIKMDHGTVKVLGTSFNIQNDMEADITTICVASGMVTFTPTGSKQEFILQANDKLIYNAGTQRYRQVKQFTPNDWSWKTKELVFQNTKLEEVIPAIENHFGIRLSLANEKLGSCRNLTATFTNASKMEVLDSFSLSVGGKIKKAKDSDTFVLYGGKCE